MKFLTGDCRTVLATLPAESVQCCVTSPPYFGLRDYGTATWDGGDPACAHQVVGAERTPWANAVPGPAGAAGKNAKFRNETKETGGHCGKCGARRIDSQIGLEPTPDAYVAEMVAVFREVRRVLRADGTCWLNIGDSYASGGGVSQPHRNSSGGFGGSDGERTQGYALAGGGFARPTTLSGEVKQKDIIGIPWLIAFALRADGWYLRQEIIWHKPNPMPESVTDRCTKAHESVFLLSKSPRYYFDAAAIAEPANYPEGSGNKYAYTVNGERPGYNANLGGGLHKIGARDTRNKRSVWTIAPQPYSGAHFATMPPRLAEICIKAGTRVNDTVLDPFGGAGTTALAAQALGRNAILVELNPEYIDLARIRVDDIFA